MLSLNTVQHMFNILGVPIILCDHSGSTIKCFGKFPVEEVQSIISHIYDDAPVFIESGRFVSLHHSTITPVIIIGPIASANKNIQSAVSIIWELLTDKVYVPNLDAYENADVSFFLFNQQESEKTHNPYSQELREQESIRSGNIDGLKLCWEETYSGEIGKLANDPLRQAKNLAIGVITLSSRSAVEGGVSPELAFSMADGFIQKIEEHISSPNKVIDALHNAQLAFAEKVNSINRSENYNPIVYKAKNYIFRNLHNKISVCQMSQEIGVNPNYLSNLFHRTEHKTLTKYILDEKLLMCENMLKYSKYSIQEISAYFAFCSQSHFTKLFKSKNGITPKEYRKIYGKDDFYNQH